MQAANCALACITRPGGTLAPPQMKRRSEGKALPLAVAAFIKPSRNGVAPAQKLTCSVSINSTARSGTQVSMRTAPMPMIHGKSNAYIEPPICATGEGTRATSAGVRAQKSRTQSISAQIVRSLCTTPLGRPVLPEV